MKKPTFSYILLFLLAFPLIVSAQRNKKNSDNSLEEAIQAFPDDGLVLVSSSVKYNFEKEKTANDLIAKEVREERFLSTRGEQNFTYAVHYDNYSEVDVFETSAHVYDNYYQSDDIFHSDVRVKYARYTLRQKGASSKIKTEKKYKDLKYLTRVYLNAPQSCMKRTVAFVIPKEFEVELVPVNFDNYDITKTEKQEGGNLVVEYKATNIEGFSDASNLPGATHIYPHILILPKRFKDKEGDEQFFSSLEALYAWYHKLVEDVDNEPEKLKEMVEELTADVTTEEEKIKNIFYWVQDNIRYIAFEDGIAGYQPQNCQTVFFNRYGDCKGMANLTKEMLLLAGLDARLVWLGTKSVATDYSTPCLASDNHMICAVKQGEEFIFLDGTEKHTALGDYAERIQNQEVLIENGDQFIRERIPVQKHTKNRSNMELSLTMNDANELVGTVVMEDDGEAMSRIMYLYARTPTDKKEESLRRYLSSSDKFTTVKDLKMPEMDRSLEHLRLEGAITMKNKVSTFDDETYVYLDPYQMFGGFDLEEDRKFPLWLSYKHDDWVNITFTIPEGYEVSFVPEGIHLDNEDFQFDIDYKQDGQTINYSVHAQLPRGEVATQNIKAWNKAVEQLKAVYEEPIVLKKK